MLEEALRRHRVRLRFTLALRGLERGLLVAAPAALVVSILVWRRLCPEALGGQELTLFLFSVFGLAGLLVGWFTPLSRATLIAAVDRAGGFGAGLLTLEDQRTHEPRSEQSSDFAPELAARVEARLASLSPRTTFPVAPPQHLRSLLLFGSLILLVVSLPQPRAALRVVLRREVSIRPETSEALVEAANQLRAEDGAREDLRDIARSAQTLARDLESESGDLGGALERIGAVEESIERLRMRDRRHRAVADQLATDPLWQDFLAGGPAPDADRLADELEELTRVASGAPELVERLERWQRDGGDQLGGAPAEAFRDDMRRLRQGAGALDAGATARLADLDVALNAARSEAIGETLAAAGEATSPETNSPDTQASEGRSAPKTGPETDPETGPEADPETKAGGETLAAVDETSGEREAISEALSGERGGSATPSMKSSPGETSESKGDGAETSTDAGSSATESPGQRDAAKEPGAPAARDPGESKPNGGGQDAKPGDGQAMDGTDEARRDAGREGNDPSTGAATGAQPDASPHETEASTSGSGEDSGQGDKGKGGKGKGDKGQEDKGQGDESKNSAGPSGGDSADETESTPGDRSSEAPSPTPEGNAGPTSPTIDAAANPDRATGESAKGDEARPTGESPDEASSPAAVPGPDKQPPETAKPQPEAPMKTGEAGEESAESGSMLADMAAGLAENLMDMGLDPSEMAPDPNEDGMLQDWARSAAEKLIDSGFKPPQELMDKVAEAAAKRLEDTPPDQLPKGSPKRQEWQERIARKLLESGLRPPSGEALERLREAAADKAPASGRKPTAWEQDMAKKLADAGFRAPKRGTRAPAGSGSSGPESSGQAGSGHGAGTRSAAGRRGDQGQGGSETKGQGTSFESAGEGPGNARAKPGQGAQAGSPAIAGRQGSHSRSGPVAVRDTGRDTGAGTGAASVGSGGARGSGGFPGATARRGAGPSRADIDEAVRRRRIPRSYERAVKAYFEGRRKAKSATPGDASTADAAESSGK